MGTAPDRLNPTVAILTPAIEQEAEKSRQARLLMTHPEAGALRALAFVLIIGKAERLQCGKQINCYLGPVHLEESSGERRRLGHITKQGNSLLRFLLEWERRKPQPVPFRNGVLLRVHAEKYQKRN